jgi:hypothetical protein
MGPAWAIQGTNLKIKGIMERQKEDQFLIYFSTRKKVYSSGNNAELEVWLKW